MWKVCLLILIVTNGSFGDWYEDGEKFCHGDCDFDPLPESLPNSIEEKYYVCRSLKMLGVCMLHASKECRNNYNLTLFYLGLANYTYEICIEDSLIYQAISKDIECIKSAEAKAGEYCFQRGSGGYTSMESYLNNADNPVSGEFSCLRDLLFIACPTIIAGFQCGQQVKPALYKLLRGYDTDIIMCGIKDMTELENRLEGYETAIKKYICNDREKDNYKICITASIDCNVPVPMTCPDSKIPRTFPATSEDLDHLCNMVTEVLECGIEVEEHCQLNAEILQFAKNLLTPVNDICDKNSILYTDIVNNLQCANEFFGSRDMIAPCFRPLEEEKIISYAKALVDQGLAEPHEENNSRQCVQEMHVPACVGVQLEKKCGANALETYVTVLRKLSAFVAEVTRGDCKKEVDQLLPILIQLHKLEEENLEEID